MPHNQWQPTGTLSTVTHRCRNNEISNITFPWCNSVKFICMDEHIGHHNPADLQLQNSSGLKYLAKCLPNFPQNTVLWAWESAVAREWQRFIFNPNHRISNLVCWGGGWGVVVVGGGGGWWWWVVVVVVGGGGGGGGWWWWGGWWGGGGGGGGGSVRGQVREGHLWSAPGVVYHKG